MTPRPGARSNWQRRRAPKANRRSVSRRRAMPMSDRGQKSTESSDRARLDEAVRGADDLLIASLKQEERHRRRRRSKLFTFTVGGLVMVTIGSAVVFGVLAAISAVDRV